MDEKALARRIALETEQLRLESEIDAAAAQVSALVNEPQNPMIRHLGPLVERGLESNRRRLGQVRQELSDLDRVDRAVAQPRPALDSF
jgi:hypothetical protein